MREHYEPLLGELGGRTRIPLRGLPSGCEAVTVPVRRNGEAKIPKDRRGRVKVSHVDLVAADPVPLFEPPPNLATADLIWILSAGRRQWPSVVKRFGDRADAVALSLVRAGGITLRCGVDPDELTIRTPDGWSLSTAWSEQAVDEIADLRPQRDPDDVRRELLGLLDGLTPPTLAAERAALATVPAGSPLAPPPETVSGAKSWATYEAALRAACCWAGMDRTPGAAELAGLAWGDTHITWSAARSIVFSQLVGREFSLAVNRSDIAIRVRGPLVWRNGSVVADAMRGVPWIGLPSEGVRIVGDIDFSARGILLVENAETFQEVCKLDDVTEFWLCIWGQGKAIVNTIDLIAVLPPVPVAAWMDLDAAGLEIFTMLTRRLGRDAVPVGMDLELLESGRPRQRSKAAEEAKATEDDMRLAARIRKDLPEPLRAVADRITQTGKAVEQQTLHNVVLPSLSRTLAERTGVHAGH
ncbi:Wadjet anti-phage system protein JetD domain-containing protein [Micromonospora sp. WMMD730]|uniref:Wadjet anti-phage system protein JetD domain-containing protein n=1 Tax=Micromonospora sp. WMMD730 TaxID=3404128 RepID=UPI003B9264FF